MMGLPRTVFALFGASLLLLATLGALAEQNSLRGEITVHILHLENQDLGSTLSNKHSEAEPGFSLDSNTTNVTTPYEAWRSLPEWIRYLTASVLLLVGIVITFWGVRLLDFSLFVIGGFIPAVIVFGILGASVPNDNPDKTAIVYATTFTVWIISGIILICCVKLAVFILGFAFGAMIALTLNPILLKYVWTAEPLANVVIWVVIFGIAGALLALCFERILLIISTALGGSFAVVGAISAMVGTFQIAGTDVEGNIPDTVWQDWAAFAGIVGLTIFGVLIQLCCTAAGNEQGGYRKMD